MDHLKIYNAIIAKARSENRIKLKKSNTEYIYYENHHIIPKCLGGGNEKENLILLTAKEHYVCHKLLTYIYKGNRKIVNAFFFMTFSKRMNKHIKSARDYQYARELLNLTPVSKETRAKLSNLAKGHIPTTKGKTYKELYGEEKANLISEKKKKGNTGKKRSEETREKQRNANLGEKNPMFGKPGHFKGTHLTIEAKQILHNLYFGKTIEEIHGIEKAKEIRKKLSKALKGKKQTSEAIENRAKKLRGKKRTEEQRKKTSETTKLAMQRPEVKENHRLAMIKLKESRKNKGGNLASQM